MEFTSKSSRRPVSRPVGACVRLKCVARFAFEQRMFEILPSDYTGQAAALLMERSESKSDDKSALPGILMLRDPTKKVARHVLPNLA